MNRAHLLLEDAPRKHSLARARLRCSLKLHLQHICNNLLLQQSLCNVFATIYFCSNLFAMYLHQMLQPSFCNRFQPSICFILFATDFSNLFETYLSQYNCNSSAIALYIRYALKKKKRHYLGNFPNMGGGVFPNPKTFVNLPSIFLYAKFILRC